MSSAPVAWRSEFVANSTATADQTQPSITALPDGGFVIVWTDASISGGDTSSDAVRGQVFDVNGNPVGTEFLVNTWTAGPQDEPSVTALSTGGFIVVWTESHDPNNLDGSYIRAQRFDASGAKTGSEFTVQYAAGSQGGQGDVFNPVVIGRPNGGYTVAYSASGVSGSWTAIEDNNSTERLIDSGSNAQDASLAALPNGDVVIVWTKPTYNSTGTEIRGEIYRGANNAPIASFSVNTTQTNDQKMASVTTLAGGGFVVVWADGSQSGGDTSAWSVRGQIFDPSGNKVGGEFLVNTTTVSSQYEPVVTALNDGGFLVAFTDYSTYSTTNADLLGQRFDANGSKVGSEFRINANLPGGQFAADMATLTDGRVVIAWQDGSVVGDTSGWGIHFRIADPRDPVQNGPAQIRIVNGADGIDPVGLIRNVATPASYYPSTGSEFSFDNGTTKVTFYGYGIVYSAGPYYSITAGTVTNVRISVSGAEQAIGYNFFFDAATLYNALAWAASGDYGPIDTLLDGFDFDLRGGSGADALTGRGGDDTLTGGAGADPHLGGNGSDTASYADAIAGVVASLAAPATNTGFAAGDTYESIENLTGSAYADRLTGDAAGNTLTGAAGNDTLDGGAGADSIVGGAGTDTASYESATAAIVLSLANPGANSGDSAGDAFDGIEIVRGSLYADQLTAGAAGAAFEGSGGDDTLLGGTGNDTLAGGGGNDTLQGSDGTDTAGFTGAWTSYTIVDNGDGSYTFTDTRSGSPDGIDLITGFEQFQFNYGGSTYTLSVAELANVAPTDMALSGTVVAHNASAGTHIGTLATTDANSRDTFSYTLTSDPSGYFEIVGSSVRVKQGAVVDFSAGNQRTIGVQVTDGHGLTYSENFTINVASPIVKWGSQIRVNTTTDYNQNDVATAVLTDGRIVATWTGQYRSTEGIVSEEIFCQILNPDGSPSGPEFIANTLTTSSQITSGVVALENGRFVVTWTSYNGGNSVRGQVFESDGSKVGGEFVASTIAPDANSPVVTALEDGFVVTWKAWVSNQYTIFQQLFDADGAKVGNQFVAKSDVGNYDSSSVIGLPDGGYLVVWTAKATATLQAQRFDNTGHAVGSEFAVSAGGVNFQTNAELAELPNGQLVIVWEDRRGSGGDTSGVGIRGRIFDANGTLVGNEFLVNTTTGGDQLKPDVAVLSDGRFVVAFQNPGGPYYGPYSRAQLFNPDGTRAGSEFDIGGYIGFSLVYGSAPSLVALADGRFLAAWHDYNNPANDDFWGSGIHAQFYDLRSGASVWSGTNADEFYPGTLFADELHGGGGDDVLDGGGNADTLDGGEGGDRASYASAGAAVTASLSNTGVNTGDAAGDTFISIEGLIGTRFNDMLGGDDAANAISGGIGADSLQGLGGEDTLVGDAGDDTVNGGGGADSLDGGAGSDTATYSEAASGVSISLAAGTGSAGEAAGDSLAGIENLVGSAFDDSLSGNDSANTLDGGAGNDTLLGYGGDDVLSGGAGADSIDGDGGSDTASYASAGAELSASLANASANTGDAAGDIYGAIENLIGGGYADVLTGNGEANRLEGGAGADTLDGLAGDDVLNGGAGADDLRGDIGSDTASYSGAAAGVIASLDNPSLNAGEAAGDTYTSIENLAGSRNSDDLTGNGNANTIDGGARSVNYNGQDTLRGLGGDDILISSMDYRDTLDGGDGIDTASFQNATSNVGKSLATTGGSTTFISIENLLGSAFNDNLSGDASANRIDGAAGDDFLTGNGGADTLVGGAGSDTANYDAATTGILVSLSNPSLNTGDAQGDVFESIEGLRGSNNADTLIGDAHDNFFLGFGGADSFIGGDGIDTVRYDTTAQTIPLVVSLENPAINTEHAAGDTFSGIENIVGRDQYNWGDALTGNAADNRLEGRDGIDTLTGGDGNDTLNGGLRNDSLVGGNGIDTATYITASTGISASLVNPAGNTNEALGDSYSSIENLEGSKFSDKLYGDGSGNRIDGSAGDDSITGDAGSDTLVGGSGADTLDGGSGTDTADYSAVVGGVHIDLSTAGPQNVGGGQDIDTFLAVENLIGSSFDDRLHGDSAANSLSGGAGNDTLSGGAGSDTLNGGDGADRYVATTGGSNETIENFVQAEGDRIDVSAIAGAYSLDDIVRTQDGADTVIDLGSGDTLRIKLLNKDNLTAGDFVFATPPNDPPVASVVSLDDGVEDIPYTIDEADLLAGVSDPDGPTLSITALSIASGGGNLVDNGDGSWTYTPAADASGAVIFDYTVTDGSLSDSSTANLQIEATNDAPVAAPISIGSSPEDDVVLIDEATLLGAAVDVDSPALQLTALTILSGGGSLIDNGNGNWVYSPASNYAGVVTFDYTISDGLLSDSATATLSILPSNDAPTDILLSTDHVAENSAAGTVVGELSALDPDGAETFTFALLNDAGGLFTIDGSNLMVAGALDHEAAASHQIEVRVSDHLGMTHDKIFSIGVSDVGAAIAGTAGNDVIDAAQTVAGQPFPTSEEDSIEGGGGDDLISALAGPDTILGGAGNDTLIGGADNDTLDGGTDTDTVNYSAAAGAVTVNLSLAGPQFVSVSQGFDTLVSIENIVGSGLGDTLTGNGNANRIDAGNGGDTVAGLGGDDLLIGGTGPDSVDGGADNDTIAGGIGNDTLIGGAGNDTADYSGLNGAVAVNLSTTIGQVTGLGTDTISLFENILGGIGNDKFTGTTGGNRMEGGNGSDQLNGLGGADTLIGGGGNDNLQGGNGNDTIVGGAGRDIMVGGGDSDTFVFNAESESAVGGQRDRINDFVQDADKVDVAAIDAMTVGADDDFAFIGTGGFSSSGTQGELRFFQLAGPGQTVVEGDIDGNGTADFQIAFVGLFNFNASDFLGVQ